MLYGGNFVLLVHLAPPPDGDGKMEAITGIRDGICIVGADGQTRWCGQTKGEIDSGISVAR